MKNNSLPFFLTIFFINISFLSHAQKPPNKQETSVWAPVNVKIDGNGEEWGELQAYNNATRIFFTVANDDKRLYLIVKATDLYIINRLTSCGIKFIISSTEKNKEDLSITYPIWNKKERFRINIFQKHNSKDEPGVYRALTGDSIMNLANKNITENAKWFLFGNGKKTDSIDNRANSFVKAAALFNDKMMLTIELSIDLNYINVDFNNTKKIDYKIQLSPMTPSDTPWGVPALFGGSTADEMKISELFSVLDFKGEYTLAKKP